MPGFKIDFLKRPAQETRQLVRTNNLFRSNLTVIRARCRFKHCGVLTPLPRTHLRMPADLLIRPCKSSVFRFWNGVLCVTNCQADLQELNRSLQVLALARLDCKMILLLVGQARVAFLEQQTPPDRRVQAGTQIQTSIFIIVSTHKAFSN